MIVLFVALAGSLGAVARFIVDGLIRTKLVGPFPWGTFLVNVSGSLLLGVLTGLVMFHAAPSTLTTVMGVGFCGGYTTFSTTNFETARLVAERHFASAWISPVATMICTVAAAWVGLAITSAI